MKTQQDNPVRMVALENLKAMCEHISGMCHRYSVSKVTRSRVWVEYSNPNEYGTEHPISVVFPCIPSDWPGDEDNPRVFLETLRVVGGRDEYDPIQSFHILFDCPHMWRSPEGTWKAEARPLTGREAYEEDVRRCPLLRRRSPPQDVGAVDCRRAGDVGTQSDPAHA